MDILLVDRVAFTIFNIDVYWYGIFITLGIFLAFIIAFFLCKRKGLDKDMPYYIIISILPIGILSARLFAVVFDSELSILDYFKFRDGGLSIIGAVLGLIQVMQNLSDPSKLGAGIAVAFVATVYGVGFANLISIPFSTKIKLKAEQEFLVKTIMIEGIMAIQAGESPALIERKLNAFCIEEQQEA